MNLLVPRLLCLVCAGERLVLLTALCTSHMVGQFMECCSLHRVALSLAHEYTVFSGSCCAEEETDEDRKKEKLNKNGEEAREKQGWSDSGVRTALSSELVLTFDKNGPRAKASGS